MMNRKLIALLVAVSTTYASMFAILGDIVEGTFDVAGDVASAPADIATGGETARERHARRDIREEEQQQRDAARREERRQRAEEARKKYGYYVE